MSKMVEEIMQEIGPCLSTDLTQLLIERKGLSPEAARQRVSRGCFGLKRLAHLPFPRNARFLYLQKDYRSPWYWEELKKSILNNSPAYGTALAAMLQRDGIMPKEHFLIACGAPIRQQKHLSSETILDRLKLANIFDEIEVPGVGTCVVLADITNSLDQYVSKFKSRLIVESILLKAIRMWLRNLGLVSFDKIMLRDESELLPKVGTFAWDLTGPSYLAPMIERDINGKPVPGFIVCDVLIGSELTEYGLRPFLHKCTTIRNLKRIGRCLQIFVADSYSKQAIQNAKKAGVVPATTESLFGAEVAKSLTQLADVLIHAAKVSIKPEIFDELFQRLSRIEGAAINLRGALFEYLVAELVRQSISQNITLNKIYRDETGAEAEVDVLAVNAKEVYFIECKGYQPFGTIDDNDVERWLKKRIPLIRKQALAHPDYKSNKMYFEFWTTGKLSETAIAMVQNAKDNTKKYTIEYRDAAAVYSYAKDVGDRALIKTLRQNFLDHPMATVELDVKKHANKKSHARQHRLTIAPPEFPQITRHPQETEV